MCRTSVVAAASALFFVPLFVMAAPAATTTQQPSMQAILSQNKAVRQEATKLKMELNTKKPVTSKVMDSIKSLQQETNKLSAMMSDFSTHQTSLTAKQRNDLGTMTTEAQVMTALMKGETQWANKGVAKNRKILQANAKGIELRTQIIEKNAGNLNL